MVQRMAGKHLLCRASIFVANNSVEQVFNARLQHDFMNAPGEPKVSGYNFGLYRVEKVFNAWLHDFSNSPGKPKVDSHKYELYRICGSLYSFIGNKASWDKNVSAGAKLRMVMYVKGDGSARNRCARCGCQIAMTDRMTALW